MRLPLDCKEPQFSRQRIMARWLHVADMTTLGVGPLAAELPAVLAALADGTYGPDCVEVDASTWHQRRMQRMGWDWSGQPSGLPASADRPPSNEPGGT